MGGGKNYFSVVRFPFKVREREAVRDFVQRLGSFAIDYITFQAGKRSDEEARKIKKFVEMSLYLRDRICF